MDSLQAEEEPANCYRTATAAAHGSLHLFPPGSAHHAAEIGCVPTLKAILQRAYKHAGLPPQVLLSAPAGLLQCLPLHMAAERGHLAMVSFIISGAGHEADVDAPDGVHAVRPLHLAAVHNAVPVLKLLLDKGANPTKQDAAGDLPSHYAANKGCLQALELLLERGVPVGAANSAGWTALHRAAFNGRAAACQLLLRRGASLNALTKRSQTPLHLAAANNHLRVMELLLQLGAATHFKDDRGATPADMCISDAAHGLIAEKEAAAQRAAAGRHGDGENSSSGSGCRPASSSAPTAMRVLSAAAAAAGTRVPRFKRTNENLDADGFPTEGRQTGHPLSDELSAQLLVVDAAGATLEGDDADSTRDCTAAMMDGLGWAEQARLASSSLSACSSFGSSRKGSGSCVGAGAGGVCAAPAASAGMLVAGGVRSTSKKGGMHAFLRAYSLDKKGLFAP